VSDYLDRPVYDDIADEARADWLAERPEPEYDFDPWVEDPDRDRQYRLENHDGAATSGVVWLGCLLGIALVLAWAAVGGAR
jgi:hypothetical protein